MERQKQLLVVGTFVSLVLLALPAAAIDRVIYNGIDLWRTEGNGSTYADFSQQPIPAGFFCNKSAPFTGRIILKGVPIVTGQPGELGRTDTIVQRLDDAVFNKRGVAVTRIQVRALEMEGVAPIKTACGLFTARVTLDGEQPITRMQIVRENENGGRFLAPIALNAKFVFTPLARKSQERFELTHHIVFPVNPQATWAAQAGKTALARAGFVLVDTDGDLLPDTFLPGTSNFAAGWTSRRGKVEIQEVCHEIEPGCIHCVMAEQ